MTCELGLASSNDLCTSRFFQIVDFNEGCVCERERERENEREREREKGDWEDGERDSKRQISFHFIRFEVMTVLVVLTVPWPFFE